jgi:hypothetical protein
MTTLLQRRASLATPEAKVELVFSNKQATPKIASIFCDVSSIPHIMVWYGSFYAGDHYSVCVNGVKVKKDPNGCLIK